MSMSTRPCTKGSPMLELSCSFSGGCAVKVHCKVTSPQHRKNCSQLNGYLNQSNAEDRHGCTSVIISTIRNLSYRSGAQQVKQKEIYAHKLQQSVTDCNNWQAKEACEFCWRSMTQGKYGKFLIGQSLRIPNKSTESLYASMAPTTKRSKRLTSAFERNSLPILAHPGLANW